MNDFNPQFHPLPPAPPSTKNWFARHKVLTGVGALVLVVAIGAAAGGGSSSDDTTATAEQKTTASAPKSEGKSGGTEATVEEPKEAPASNGPSNSFPMQDGDWRLDSLTVGEEDYGDSFDGRGRITYTGDDSDGGNNSFTITIFANGKDVGTLEGSLMDVQPGQTKTVDLYSFDKFVKGKLTYTFQNDW